MSETWENPMDTPYLVALHYVECYALHFPDSGANWAANDLRKELEISPKTPTDAEVDAAVKRIRARLEGRLGEAGE